MEMIRDVMSIILSLFRLVQITTRLRVLRYHSSLFLIFRYMLGMARNLSKKIFLHFSTQ